MTVRVNVMLNLACPYLLGFSHSDHLSWQHPKLKNTKVLLFKIFYKDIHRFKGVNTDKNT